MQGKMSSEYSSQTPESEFNMGVSHLQRIDAILDAIAECSLLIFEGEGTRKSIQNWFYLLTSLNKEVDFLYDEEEIKESTRLFNATSKLINEWVLNQSSNTKFEAVWNSLLDLERWVKKQLIKRKMLMKFGKDKTKAIIDL